jgi:hypothetical protein
MWRPSLAPAAGGTYNGRMENGRAAAVAFAVSGAHARERDDA